MARGPVPFAAVPASVIITRRSVAAQQEVVLAWRFTGRAKVDPNHPSAFGVCDRCGFWDQLDNLRYQHEWRGPRLMNIRLRVCAKCMDVPNNWSRPIIYPPDPVPRLDPRPQNFQIPDNGSPFPPPLPWPSQESGPVVPMPPTPEWPVYVTPPNPPLPPDIEEGGATEP